MQKTLGDLARIVGGEVVGDPSLVITGARGIKEAREGDITFVANPRYASLFGETQASAVITSMQVERAHKPLIRVKDPSLAFAQVVATLYPVELKHPKGIHPSACIAKSAKLGAGVAVGANVVIEEHAEVGDNTIIYAGSYIGHDTKIGRDCLIWPNVSIRERVEIGSRVSIQSGTVIGSEGFGYARVDGVYKLIPQIGTVKIEDDVEIGANVTIDRARFDKTIVGRGTKIDNLVQIAHNVVIGENSIIVAQAGISGSTRIGSNVTIAGQAGLVGHIEIGDGAVLAAQAGIMNSVPSGMTYSGYPARPHQEAMKIYGAMKFLPQLVRDVNALKRKMGLAKKDGEA